MNWTRRHFLTAPLAAGAGRTGVLRARGAIQQPCFSLHPFIEANPGAVFVRRTRAAHRADAVAMRADGLRLARQILLPSGRPGVPVTHRVILKPNVICPRWWGGGNENWGTDPEFYEGILARLKELGVGRFHFVEANYYYSRHSRRFDDIHEAYGVETAEPDRRVRQLREGHELTWSRVPDSVVYQRIPHYAPINQPDTWLLNVAKWRSHGMCLTQSAKNLQGLTVRPWQRFCPGWEMVTGVPDYMKPEIHPQVEARVMRYFESHRRMGYSRYDSADVLSPIRQEIWAHKTCDNLSVLKPGLSIIEGIYVRNEDPSAAEREFLPNLVMFGKDPFRLDVIGLWLGGHEPGNVHLYRIAKERGLSSTFNPWEIPVYEWTDSGPERRKLADLPRTYLTTYYLSKPGEPRYHLVNEPFDYDRVKL